MAERTVFIEVQVQNSSILTDSIAEDLIIYTETSNQGILLGNYQSNVSALAIRNNSVSFSSNIYISGRTGIATSNPQVSLEVNTTDAILIPRGTTAQRPIVPALGHIRYNSSINAFEGYGTGNTWGTLGGIKDTNLDTYISAESYPTSNDDILRFFTSNNEVMRIMKNGYVGVSNQTPSERLEISGGNAKFNSNVYILEKLGVGTSNPSCKADIYGTTRIYETSGTANNPTAGSLVIQHGNGGGVSSIVFPSAVNLGSDHGYISYYDNVVGTGNNYFNGSGNECSALILGVENDGSNSSGPDSVIITPAGNVAIVPRNSITYISSNVGIGITAPTETLDVIKNVKVGSNIYILSRIGVSASNPTEAIDVGGNIKASGNIYAMSRIGIATSNPTEVVDINGNAKVGSNMYVMTNVGIGTSNPSVNLEVNGSAKINSNLEVIGNITVRGTTTTVDSTTVNILDNIIRLNNGASYNATLQAGIEVNRGTGYSNYYFIFDEASDYFKVGMQGQLQTVATRDDTLPTNSIAFYDSANVKYTGCNNFVYANNRLGVGVSNPGYTVDVRGTGLFRNGNIANSATNNQLLFSYSLGSNYIHSIKTRHDAANNSVNNAIDFYVWQTSDSAAAIGTKQVMSVTSAGVGINTTSPAYTLDVSGTVNATTMRTSADLTLTGKTILLNSTAFGDGIIFNGTSSNMRIYYDSVYGMLNYIDTSEKWSVVSTGTYPRLTVLGTGNVGVGTNTPTETIDVNGNGKVASNMYILGSVGVGTSNPSFKLHNALGSVFIGDISYASTTIPSTAPSLSTANGHRLVFDNTYNASAGSGMAANKIVLHNNNFLAGFGVENGTVTYHSGLNHSFYVSTNNSNSYGNHKMMITPTGVGVGMRNPSESLEIVGNVKASSNIYALVRLGIATSNPQVALEVNATDAILIPQGTTVQRPTAPVKGYIRYNTSTETFEGYGAGNAWGVLGGVKDGNLDTYISAESYPTSNDDILRFYTSNNEVMRIMTNGFIGVSNIAPTERIEVSGGNAKFNSNVYVLSRLGVSTSNPTESIDVASGNAKFNSNVYVLQRLGVAKSNPTEALDIAGNLKTSGNTFLMGNVGVGTSNPSVSMEVNGSAKINSNLEVVGNITVRGTTTTVDSTTVNILDNIIRLNNGAAYNSTLQAGIEINRGSGYSNYYFVFDEASDYYKVGMQGQLQVVATRDDSLPSNAIAFYDTSNLKYTGCNALVYANGNMGVGLANPVYTVDVAGTTMMRNGNTSNSATNSQLLLSYNLNSNYAHAIKSRHDTISNTVNNAIDFYVWQTTDGVSTPGTKQVMSVTSAGVGINTTSPAYTLDVTGTINASNIRTSADLSMVGKNILINSRIWGDGIVFNGLSSNMRVYHDAAQGLLNHIDTGDKWQVMSVGTVSRLSVLGTGNVGIGYSNPSEALDVNKNIKAASNIYAMNRLGIASSNPTEALDITGNMKITSNIYTLGGKVAIGTSNPQVALEINATDAILLPKGTTAQRPAVPVQGHVRYNTSINTFEGYGAGNAWGSLGGVKDINQDTYISAESYPTSNDDILRFYTSNNEVMRIMTNGYIGVSNIAPGERLEISGGNAKFNSNVYVLGNIAVGKSNPTVPVDIIGNTAIDGNMSSTKYVLSRGIQILNRNGTSYSNNLVTANVIGISNDSLGMNFSIQNATSSNYFKFQASSNEIARITGTGMIGIGLSNPLYPLDVVGNVNISGNVSAGNLGIFRNRIINGDMSIDQRRNGVAANTANNTYYLDKWNIYQSVTTGTMSIQRVGLTSSDTGPWERGFKYSVKCTATTALTNYSYWALLQKVEGIYISDFNWAGNSSGSYITISFWFKASQTGLYTVCVRNALVQSWINTVTVSSSNTWNYYTLVVPPPPGTGATWNNNDNQSLMELHIGNIVKSSQTVTTGWSVPPATAYQCVTGFVDWVTTTNAYIQITGVQLEKGSIPTPFEFRLYMLELQLCQRYYEVIFSQVVSQSFNMGYYNGIGNAGNFILPFKVNKRDTPVLASGSVAGNNGTLSSLFTVENVQYNISVTGATNFWFTVSAPLAYSSEL